MTPEELAELEKRKAAEDALAASSNAPQNELTTPSTTENQHASAAAVGSAGTGGTRTGEQRDMTANLPSAFVPPPAGVMQDQSPEEPNPLFNDVDEEKLNTAAANRALEMILEDEALTEEELARQRESANAITARETADLKARSGAGGFGVSFASDAAISDIARSGQRETELSLDDAKRQSKADQLDRILAGAGLSRATSAENRTAEQEALLNELIKQTLDEEEPVVDAPPELEAEINDILRTAGTGDLAGASSDVRSLVYEKALVFFRGMGLSETDAQRSAAVVSAGGSKNEATASPEEIAAQQGVEV